MTLRWPLHISFISSWTNQQSVADSCTWIQFNFLDSSGLLESLMAHTAFCKTHGSFKIYFIYFNTIVYLTQKANFICVVYLTTCPSVKTKTKIKIQSNVHLVQVFNQWLKSINQTINSAVLISFTVSPSFCHHGKVIELSEFKRACSNGSPAFLWSQNHGVLPQRVSVQLSWRILALQERHNRCSLWLFKFSFYMICFENMYILLLSVHVVHGHGPHA